MVGGINLAKIVGKGSRFICDRVCLLVCRRRGHAVRFF